MLIEKPSFNMERLQNFIVNYLSDVGSKISKGIGAYKFTLIY